MNVNCKKEIQNCNSINEMVTVINKYYDLDKPLGMMTAGIVKARVTQNFTEIIQKLEIKERPGGENKKGILSF